MFRRKSYDIFEIGGNYFDTEKCFTGFQIFGGTGSGKTSGSGSFIASAMLASGFGGLVLTFKPD